MLNTCSKCKHKLEKPRTHARNGYAICLKCLAKRNRERSKKRDLLRFAKVGQKVIL